MNFPLNYVLKFKRKKDFSLEVKIAILHFSSIRTCENPFIPVYSRLYVCHEIKYVFYFHILDVCSGRICDIVVVSWDNKKYISISSLNEVSERKVGSNLWHHHIESERKNKEAFLNIQSCVYCNALYKHTQVVSISNEIFIH